MMELRNKSLQSIYMLSNVAALQTVTKKEDLTAAYLE